MNYPITINGVKFDRMILASDEAEIAEQLHAGLPENGGIICVFPQEERLSFWMKDIPADLEIVFINNRNHIVGFKTMKAEAPRGADESEIDYENRLPNYSSGCPARAAVEFACGTWEKLRLKVGGKFPVDLSQLWKK